MYQALIIVHVLIALGIIALVLLQHGKGADAGAAFGSGASGTVFGAQGSATFLTRATAVLATLFFVTSLSLAILGDTRSSGEEGFMEAPAESVPSDLPLSEQDLNPVSDMPEIPSAVDKSVIMEEESVVVEETVDEPSLPPVTEEAESPEIETGETAEPVLNDSDNP